MTDGTSYSVHKNLDGTSRSTYQRGAEAGGLTGRSQSHEVPVWKAAFLVWQSEEAMCAWPRISAAVAASPERKRTEASDVQPAGCDQIAARSMERRRLLPWHGSQDRRRPCTSEGERETSSE